MPSNYTCTVHVLVMHVSHPVIIPYKRSSFHLGTNITVSATLPSSQSTYLCDFHMYDISTE